MIGKSNLRYDRRVDGRLSPIRHGIKNSASQKQPSNRKTLPLNRLPFISKPAKMWGKSSECDRVNHVGKPKARTKQHTEVKTNTKQA
ncbi:MAG: hypothetical protein J07AB43_01800 [Candidatus Nanosalina sp. J07AB43]|nr:MAG: hypothetical protein J07AB43_01800 [Candidatus Nanosalina sp. J07AB43]